MRITMSDIKYHFINIYFLQRPLGPCIRLSGESHILRQPNHLLST